MGLLFFRWGSYYSDRTPIFGKGGVPDNVRLNHNPWYDGYLLNSALDMSKSLNHEMYVTVTYKYMLQYEIIHSVKLIHCIWYDVNPLYSIGIVRQNHWTMNKGQGQRMLRGCIAATTLKGIAYLTKYELSVSKVSITTKNFALKHRGNTKVGQP